MAAGEIELVKHLQELLEPVVLDHGLELAELQFRREGTGLVLRLVIDADEGVGLDDCSRVSREVSHLLEVEDPIKQPYSLEVSSPGLDRPLKREQDYRRSRGKLAKLVCQQPVADRNVVVGRLGDLTDDGIMVETEEGPVLVPLAMVKRARLLVEW